MSTKKKFNLSVYAAIYGFMGAIAYPIFMGLKFGFDSAVPDSAISYIVIDLIIGFIGLLMSVVNYRKMSAEKFDEISGTMVRYVCKNCKTNVKPGVKVCPKCGSLIK